MEVSTPALCLCGFICLPVNFITVHCITPLIYLSLLYFAGAIMSRLLSFTGHCTTSFFHFRCFTLLRKHLWLFLASCPLCFVEDLFLFKKTILRTTVTQKTQKLQKYPILFYLLLYRKKKVQIVRPMVYISKF